MADPNLKPEQKARDQIDAMLEQVGRLQGLPVLDPSGLRACQRSPPSRTYNVQP